MTKTLILTAIALGLGLVSAPSFAKGYVVNGHARGREAVLYSARAGVDLIFHAYYLDDECIGEILKSGSTIGPTLTFMTPCASGASA